MGKCVYPKRCEDWIGLRGCCKLSCSKSFEDGAIIGGTPAKLIKRKFLSGELNKDQKFSRKMKPKVAV